MKKMIKRASSYAFWVGLSSAVVVLVESIGKLCGFSVDSSVITEVIMSVCGVLVVLGLVTKDDSAQKDTHSDDSGSTDTCDIDDTF